jgi:hypothetical protein
VNADSQRLDSSPTAFRTPSPPNLLLPSAPRPAAPDPTAGVSHPKSRSIGMTGVPCTVAIDERRLVRPFGVKDEFVEERRDGPGRAPCGSWWDEDEVEGKGVGCNAGDGPREKVERSGGGVGSVDERNSIPAPAAPSLAVPVRL